LSTGEPKDNTFSEAHCTTDVTQHIYSRNYCDEQGLMVRCWWWWLHSRYTTRPVSISMHV